jgi:hypothetical protein
MKYFISTFFILLYININAQSMKITWEDSDGRKFSIVAPDGELEFGSIPGDRISYGYAGYEKDKITSIGNCKISYGYAGTDKGTLSH